MDAIEKFFRKLTPKQQQKLREALKALAANQLTRLDIKPLAGKKGWFRCRVGNIRIIFIRTSAGKHVIYAIDFRGSVYKK